MNEYGLKQVGVQRATY